MIKNSLLYATLTLVFCTFFHEPILAADIKLSRHSVAKNKDGQYILDLEAILHSQPDGIHLLFAGDASAREVAQVSYYQGVARVASQSSDTFSLQTLPKSLKALQVNINGTLELRAQAYAPYVNITAKAVTNHAKFDIAKILMLEVDKYINTRNGVVKVGEYFKGNFSQYIDDGLTEVMGLALINSQTGRLNGNFNGRNNIIYFKDDLIVSKNANFVIENHLTLHSDKNLNFDGQARVGDQKSWPKVQISPEILPLIRKLPAQVVVSAKGDLHKNGSILSRNTSISYLAGGKYDGKNGQSRSGFFAGNIQQIAAAEAYLSDQIRSFDKIFLSANNVTLEKSALVSSDEQTLAAVNNNLRNNGKMSSKNHVLQAKSWFDNTGSINSEELLLVDTAISTNRVGGNMCAKSAVINADYLALNIGATLSAEHTEINSLLNINALGRVVGTKSLTINAPLLNANLVGQYQSNNYTSNSLINFSGGLVTRASLPTLYDVPWLDLGLTMASLAYPASGIKELSSLYYLGTSLASTVSSVNQIVSEPMHMTRPSSLAKKFGHATRAAISVHSLHKQFQSPHEPKNDEPMPLWSAVKTSAKNYLSGQATINSFYDDDHGVYLTGHRAKRNWYNYDQSYIAAISANTITNSGVDQSYMLASQSTTTAIGDYTLGGNKKIYEDFSVSSGGDLTIASNTNLQANSVIAKSESAINIEKDTVVHGHERTYVDAKKDLTADEGSRISGGHVTALCGANANVLGMITGTQKTHVQAKQDLMLGSEAHIGGKDVTVLDGGNAKILGAVAGSEKTHVQSSQSLFTGERSKIGGGDVSVLAGTDAVVLGTINGSGKTNVEAKQNLTTGEESLIGGTNVTALAGEDAKILGAVNGAEKTHVQSNQNLLTGEQSKISGGDVTVLAGENALLQGSIKGISTAHIEALELTLDENSHTSAKKVTVIGKNDWENPALIAGQINGSESVRIDAPLAKLTKTAQINGQTVVLNESCTLDLESGFKIDAENLVIIAPSIPQLGCENNEARIENLMTQTGLFSGLNVTKNLALKTDEPFRFNQNCCSASENFELFAPRIDVYLDKKVSAPGILRLHATDGNLNLYTSTLNADFIDLYATGDVKSEHSHTGTPYKGRRGDGYGSVAFTGCKLNGGVGATYIYVDPDTQVQSERKVAVRIRAGGEVKVDGLAVAASRGDIHIDGKTGVTNKGDAYRYSQTHHRDNKDWTSSETAFFSGSYSTPGKLVIKSEEGGYSQEAGQIFVHEGADICTNDSIKMTPLHGQKSRKGKVNELEDTSLLVNLGNSTVRLCSTKGDVNAPGLRYYGPQGNLVIKGKNIYLDRSILEHTSKSASLQPSFDYTAFSQWKSFEAAQAAKDFMSDMAAHNYGQGLITAVNPSVTAAVDHVNTTQRFQTLGEGFITTKGLKLYADKEIGLNNGFLVKVYGDADIHAPDLKQEGARLKSSTTIDSAGVYVTISVAGIEVGMRTNITKTDRISWVPAQFNVDGTANFAVCNFSQDAAVMNVNKATGHIECLASRTRQDTSETKSLGVSEGAHINWSGAVTPTVSVRGSYKETREANHKSGLFVGEDSDLTIDKANLTGASLEKITAHTTSYKSLPQEYKDRGFSLGLSSKFSPDGAAHTVTTGVSNNGHEVELVLNISMQNKPQEKTQLLDTIGTVSYRNKDKDMSLTVPLVTGINTQVFRELADDVKHIAQDIGNLFASHQPEGKKEVLFEKGCADKSAKSDPEGISDDIGEFFVPIREKGDSNEQKLEAEDVALELSTKSADSALKSILGIALGDLIAANMPLELEILETPHVFVAPGSTEKHFFGYSIKGTSIYFKSAEEFNMIVGIIEKLDTTASPFGKPALKAIKKLNGAYFYPSAQTPLNTAGNYYPYSKFIIAATKDPQSSPLEIIIHEAGGHGSVPKGKSVPGNMEEFLVIYMRDYSNCKQNFSEAQWNKWPNNKKIDFLKIFDIPGKYFTKTFLDGIVDLGLSEAEINEFCISCGKFISEGKVPNFDGHVHADILNRVARDATEVMMGEVTPFIAEASLNSLDLVEEIAPKTYEYLKKHHLKTPWYKSSTAKTTGSALVVGADLGLHVWAERRAGKNWSDAFVEGGVKTAVESTVNIPIYTGITMLWGAPIAWMTAGTVVILHFTPSEQLEQNINEKNEQAFQKLSREGHSHVYNCLASEDHFEHAEILEHTRTMKKLFGHVQKLCDHISQNVIDDIKKPRDDMPMTIDWIPYQ